MRHIVVERKTTYEVFGKKGKRSVRPSQEDSKIRMVQLFVAAKIFLIEDCKARPMTQNTFWDYVRKPKNVGSDKDKEKEGKNRSERQ